MVKRYKVYTRDGSVVIVEMFPGVNYGAIHSREYVHADDYDALARDLAACKVARDGWTKASDEAHDRIRELEAALRIIASYTGHDSAAWAAKETARGALAGSALETGAKPSLKESYTIGSTDSVGSEHG